MASDGGSFTFFALPREIRDLIYTCLTPKDETYTIRSAIAVAIAYLASPRLGILSASRAFQYEML